MDSPLLSYIDVWHAHFLLPSLIVGEARDLSPRYTTTEDFAPVRDESAERVSQSQRAHIPVEEPVVAESVNSSEAESDPGKDGMVTRRALTIGDFIPSAQPASQQQEPRGRDPTSPPPPFGCSPHSSITKYLLLESNLYNFSNGYNPIFLLSLTTISLILSYITHITNTTSHKISMSLPSPHFSRDDKHSY